MIKQKKFTEKQLKEFREVVLKSGRNSISNIQIRTGLGYEKASQLYEILNEDKSFAKEVLKYQKKIPLIINKFVTQVKKEILKIKDKDYLDWDYITDKLGIKYDFQREVLTKLRVQGHITDTRIYLIKKNSLDKSNLK